MKLITKSLTEEMLDAIVDAQRDGRRPIRFEMPSDELRQLCSELTPMLVKGDGIFSETKFNGVPIRVTSKEPKMQAFASPAR